MTTYLLLHKHRSRDCPGALRACLADTPRAARRRADFTPSHCSESGHRIWWTTQAITEREALEVVPEPLRDSTIAVPVA
jgi:hypothetical protein